jgi:hypothetical protein
VFDSLAIFNPNSKLQIENFNPMNVKNAGALAGLAVVALALHGLWLWQPERQILKHHRHFLDAVARRNWTRVAAFMDESFTTRWGYNKTDALRESREVLGQFFSLTITGEPAECLITGSTATVSVRLKFEGNGTAVAEYAKNEVNALTEPFAFQWTRKSWKPWDWKLAGVDNPQLRLDHLEGF